MVAQYPPQSLPWRRGLRPSFNAVCERCAAIELRTPCWHDRKRVRLRTNAEVLRSRAHGAATSSPATIACEVSAYIGATVRKGPDMNFPLQITLQDEPTSQSVGRHIRERSRHGRFGRPASMDERR